VLIAVALLASLFPHGEVAVQSAPVAVRINGVDINWISCASALPPGELERALGERWQRASAPQPGNEWWVFRHREGTVLHALQLRPSGEGGSSGYCSALDAAARPRPPARPVLALPGGSAIHSVIEQLDAGARSVQFLGGVAGDPVAWRRQLLRRASSGGWQQLGDPGVATGSVQRSGQLQLPLSLVRAGTQLDVVVLPGAAGWQFLLNQHPAPGVRP
jgi:hypothetical protein